MDAISSPLGLRSVRERDIPSLTVLLNRHLSSSSSHSSFEISPVFTEEQVRHQFLPRENVIYSLVGENEDGELIEFVSFYSLNSMVIAPPTVWPGHDIRNLLSTSGVSSSSTVNTGVDDDELAKLDKECNDPSNTIKTAHLYYYVPPLSTRRSAGSIKSSSAPREESLLDEMITKTIHVARQLGYHQLTCLDVMGNSRFLDRLGFVKNAKNAGLNYFLYNYRFRNVQADKMAFLIV